MIIIIIIIISSVISSNISFVVLLNCLYLNPQVSPFVHFSSPSHWGGRRGVNERLSSAQLPAAGLNYDSPFLTLVGVQIATGPCLKTGVATALVEGVGVAAVPVTGVCFHIFLLEPPMLQISSELVRN